MRTFANIQRDLNLRPWVPSPSGDLYYVPLAPDAPDWLVRRFDRDLKPDLIPVYVDLHAAAQAWIDSDPQLSNLVRVEQPIEVGEDFIARAHVFGTHLSAILGSDPDEGPLDPPDELAPMQARFRAREPCDEREELLKTILTRSLLEPTSKTFYVPAEERFVVADLKLTPAELERWRELSPRR
ncbi:MAG TPA: hypothetical protein VIK91_16810 [Nannocystis sp.]